VVPRNRGENAVTVEICGRNFAAAVVSVVLAASGAYPRGAERLSGTVLKGSVAVDEEEMKFMPS
jgi:hypothetical protein